MKSCGRSFGAVSGGTSIRRKLFEFRVVHTQERRKLLDLDLFCNDKPAAALLPRRLSYDRDSVLGPCAETVERA